MDKAEMIWHTYRRLMYAIALSSLGNEQDAEDAVSDAMERILRNLDCFDEVPSPRARNLCAVIVRNLCRDRIRRKNASPFAETEAEEEDAPPAPSAENVWLSAETADGVRRCLGMIPEAYADILRLRMANDCTMREIAGILGISEQNARTRLSRARAALLNKLREEGVL